MGEYVVIPAQSKGAAPARFEVRGDAQDEPLVDDDAVGVAAVGDASEMLVRRVVGEGQVRAELLEAGLALGAGAVGVDHAADRGEVAGLELGDGGADLGDAADDLVAGDAGVDGGHDAAPLVADWWRSEWQMPQKRISICTSCSVGSRRVIVVEASGDVALAAE